MDLLSETDLLLFEQQGKTAGRTIWYCCCSRPRDNKDREKEGEDVEEEDLINRSICDPV